MKEMTQRYINAILCIVAVIIIMFLVLRENQKKVVEAQEAAEASLHSASVQTSTQY